MNEVRLIDANLLKRDLENFFDKKVIDEPDDILHDVFCYIENAPLERPQGEWKMDSIGAYCSNCHTHPDYTTNFCPNCGADMRGDE